MGLLNWLRGKLASTAPVQDAQPTAPPPRAAIRISDEALVASARFLKPLAPVKVFSVPLHPPGVGPKRSTSKGALALDSAIQGTQQWANSAWNQQALASVGAEGVTFLGYAFLSELAQRPEYRVIAETIASEMTRKWIRFTAKEGEDKADRIAELDAEFKRLNVRDMFCRAAEQDGFFGRGHIYIDTGATGDPDELKLSIGDGWDTASKAKISKRNPIKGLRTIEAVWTYPTSYNSNDPLQDNWYRPDQWYVQAKIVHTSRILTFIGREVPDLLKPSYSFGGLAMTQMAMPYVNNWLETRQSVTDLIVSFTTYVLKTNLQETMQADGDQLFKRAALFNNTRRNSGLMMLDKESEEFENISVPLSGLGELKSLAKEDMAMVAHTPTVKLFGIQPAGLNADSDGVMRAYYDYVHSYQEHLFRKPLHRLMGLVMLSLWGKTDDAIDFEFEPLWALDGEQLATVEKTKAETDQILIDSGVISPEESRKRIANDDGSDYTSIDPEDVPDMLEEEQEGLVPAHGHVDPELVEEGDGDDTALNDLFDKGKKAA
jgi:phage-related protein (TIGR01555 family)